MKHLMFVLALLLGLMPAQQRERTGRGQQLPRAELQARLEAAQQRLQELQQRLQQRRAEHGDEQHGRGEARRPEQRGDRRRGPAQGREPMRQHRGPARPMLRAVMQHRLHQHGRQQLPGHDRGQRGRSAPAHGGGGETHRPQLDRRQRDRDDQQRRPQRQRGGRGDLV